VESEKRFTVCTKTKLKTLLSCAIIVCCFACNFVNIIWQWESEWERYSSNCTLLCSIMIKKIIIFCFNGWSAREYIHISISLSHLIRVFLYKMEYKKARLWKKIIFKKLFYVNLLLLFLLTRSCYTSDIIK
jgi:hypothetical protein